MNARNDSSLSLSNDGEIRYGPDVDMEWDDFNTSSSLLWTKLNKAFAVEIADRYRELRLKEFTPEFILRFINDEIIAKIPHTEYNNDVKLKYLIPESLQWIKVCNGTRLEHTKRWLEERFIYLDSVFEYGDFVEKRATIRSNMKGEVTLRVKTYSPQKLKVKFSDAASNEVKVLVSKDKWYEITGTINNGVDNNIYIYGATGLMYIDGLRDLQVSNLAIANATKLVEVDCRGSRHLNQLQLGQNRLLQKVDVSNCVNLGSIAEFKRLDLSQCVNLKYLDCSNTKLGEVMFNEEGGALEKLNMSNTDLTALSLVGQEYLPSIELDNCRELSSIHVEACNAVTSISMPYSRLSSFKVVDCNVMNELNISYTGQLTKLDLSGCPNLTKLVMSGVSNPAITELDLTYCGKINHLDMSKCDFLGLVKFKDGCNTLKYFNAAHSGIKQFKYGRNDAAAYLDLGGFTLDYVNFENAAYVEEVHNINLEAKGSMKPFYNCKNLRKIKGRVVLRDSISEGFMHCEKLMELPATFDLTNVTSLSDTFHNCKSLTRDMVIRILSGTPKNTNLYRTFANCTSVVFDEENPLPANLFTGCPKVTNLYWTFIGCSKMKNYNLPIGIMDPMTELVTWRQPFQQVTGILPPTLFAKNTKLTTVWDFISSNTITNVPSKDLFNNCPRLERITGFMNGWKTATGRIPAEIFANNPNLRYADTLFTGATGLLGEIPSNLFTNNRNLLTIRSAFNGCTGLTGSIPGDLLNNNNLLTDIGYLFYNCTGLTGPIPAGIMANNPSVSLAEYLFGNCSALGGIPGELQEVPPTILKNKRSLTDASGMFSGCTLLQFTIPGDLLSDCVSLVKVNNMFNGCKGLNGVIPETLFDVYDAEGVLVENYMSEAIGMFSGCEYLSGSIPENLFKNFLLVKDLSNFFSSCNRIEGEIPATLFHNCLSVIKMDNIFGQCWALGKYRVTPEDPFFIDPDMFMNCANLESLNNAFNMYNGTSKLIGEISEDLFMYCRKLKHLNHTFAACHFTGTISNSMFRNNPALENVEGIFRDSAITGLESQVFTLDKHPKITNFTRTFSCSSLTGEAPALWVSHPSAQRAECFRGATGLSNYADIPDTWK